ncbi:translation initiation Sua5 protein [Rutstroemia sp. NJR-2017a BBW]|nr:translation initiation Sua5 protein [Rutstroemia sp. NJR-2017a BBW]
MASTAVNGEGFQTRVLPVATSELGQFSDPETLDTWELPKDLAGLESLQQAAKYLQSSDIPVAFPTETVYGLGADATRSNAVKGIYKAKGRPKLAPEVTAGLQTFGARMPSSQLALSLIKLAGVPLAAPSANASTKPSCTTAEHVLHDLNGRIEIILDGGACKVGVESTVVDGLCNPPVVLRPGGVSIDEIRECEGWGTVVKGYKDQSEIGDKAPRAPGMKYKHYSPKAKVILYENAPDVEQLLKDELASIATARTSGKQHVGYEGLPTSRPLNIGVISTKNWISPPGLHFEHETSDFWVTLSEAEASSPSSLHTVRVELRAKNNQSNGDLNGHAAIINQQHLATAFTIPLGSEIKDIAHGLFSALRELDQRGCDMIYVEGIRDEGDIAAAVMNRLRKAATVIIK